MTDARIASGPLAAGFAARIGDAWDSARQGFAGVGALLIEAKDALPHGTFEAMIAADLPFTAQTARKLMAVARADFLDRAPGRDLPGEWTTLYELTKLGPEGFEQAVAAGDVKADTTRGEAARLVKRHKAARATLALPSAPAVIGCDAADLARAAADGARFRVIYADPAWPYETWSDKGADKSPERHYRTMPVEDICALPIADLAADDAVLILWVVPWLLFEARDVIEAWGFKAKSTAFTWVKAEIRDGALVEDISTGKWTRKVTELSVIATRGAPSPLATDVRDWRMARAAAHSEKPEVFAQDIEKISTGPYLELFARRPRDGWSVWGDQVAPGGVFARTPAERVAS